MAHSAELQRFIGGGDLRQLYALDRRSGEIVYMDDGEAETLRPDCRAGHLICPIEGCPSPTFTTYGGTVRRHHFKHLNGGASGHGAESYYHQLGKRVLGQHLRQRHPEARVSIDTEPIDNGQRPDVLVAFPDGRRFAFELQYSPLSAAAWTARHQGYVSQGLHDVWIFGHLPPHLRPARHGQNAVELTKLAEALEDEELPVRFFSPDERQIATATVESDVCLYWEAVSLAYDELVGCEIRGECFWTPTDEQEAVARAQRLDEERQADAKREAQRQIDEAREAARERQSAKEAEWRAGLKTQRRQRQARWEAAAPRFLQLVGLDKVPPVISCELRSDWGTVWHPAHWHARLFYEFIEGKIGETFSFPQAIRRFYDAQPYDKKQANVALGGYLFHLRRLGYLRFDSEGYRIEDDILVVADLHHPPDAELVRELRYALLLASDDSLVLANATGRVLRRLRPLRPDDSLWALGEVQVREEERQGHRTAWEAKNDSAARMGGRDLRVETSPGEVGVCVYADLWLRLRTEIREIAACHPGDARLTVTVFARGGPALRDISMSHTVAASDELARALEALAPLPEASRLGAVALV
jgi:hypothetical protein